jgi:hypothetical protein
MSNSRRRSAGGCPVTGTVPPSRRWWHYRGVLAQDAIMLSGIKLTGLVMGLAFLWIAIRMMFGKGGKKKK